MEKVLDSLFLLGPYIRWSPLPRRPWGVHEHDGRIVKRFDTAEQAQQYLIRLVGSAETEPRFNADGTIQQSSSGAERGENEEKNNSRGTQASLRCCSDSKG